VRNVGVAATARPANASQALADAGADDAVPLGPDDYTGLPANARTGIQGLAALELDPYREGGAGLRAECLQGHRSQDRQPLRKHALPIRGARLRQGTEQRSRHRSTDQSDRHAIRSVLLSLDHHLGPQYRRSQADPAGAAIRLASTRAPIPSAASFKAPANETLRGVLDLEYDINDNSQDVLNPRGVNAIRRFPGAVSGSGALARSPPTRSGNTSQSRRLFHIS